jgi:hypothetical protein
VREIARQPATGLQARIGVTEDHERREAWLRSVWAIAGVGPLDAIAAAMGHVEECDR